MVEVDFRSIYTEYDVSSFGAADKAGAKIKFSYHIFLQLLFLFVGIQDFCIL